MRRFLALIGSFLEQSVRDAGFALELLGSTTKFLRHGWRRRRFLLNQLYICGVRPLPVVLVVALFTGMILALQIGIELRSFGATEKVANIIGVTLCREMGPFMTALILTASVGAGMAAELGTMKVSEEIDALDVMSIPAPSFLVMPRLVAMAVMTPTLTFVTDVVGTLGGCLISWQQLGISPRSYFEAVFTSLGDTPWVFDLPKDLYTGLAKGVVFGVIIATVSCATGLRTSGGALGVGRATRSAVIRCFLLIIIVGFFMTSFFYRI